MGPYRGCGGLAVATRDGIGNRPVFVTARAAIECLPQMKGPISYRPIMQLTGNIAHDLIASQIGESTMKCAISLNEIIELRLRIATDLDARQLSQGLSLLRRRTAGCVTRQVRFNGHARFEDLQNFGNAARL